MEQGQKTYHEEPVSQRTNAEFILGLLGKADKGYLVKISENSTLDIKPYLFDDSLKNAISQLDFLPAIKLPKDDELILPNEERIFMGTKQVYCVFRNYIFEELLRKGFVSSASIFSRIVPSSDFVIYIDENDIAWVEETGPENIQGLF